MPKDNKPARLSSCSQDTGSMPILGSMTTRVNEPRFTISSRRGCMWPPSHLMHTPIICDNVYSLMVARSYNAVIASSQFESDVVLRVIHDGATLILHHDSSIMILVSAPLQLPPQIMIMIMCRAPVMFVHSSEWTLIKKLQGKNRKKKACLLYTSPSPRD